MTGPLLKSLAKEVLRDLPATKPAGVENALLRAGVKPEELRFMNAGLDPKSLTEEAQIFPMLDAKGRITQSSLAGKNRARQDKFGEDTTSSTHYLEYLPEGAEYRMASKSYKERIITFRQKSEAAEDIVADNNHFNMLDYLMHTRSYDELIAGADTRVVAEIQSDLHQKGLAEGKRPAFDTAMSHVAELTVSNPAELRALYGRQLAMRQDEFLGGNNLPVTDKDVLDYHRQDVLGKISDMVEEAGVAPSVARDTISKLETALNEGATANQLKAIVSSLESQVDLVEAPWKSNWMRKGLENEVLHAIKDGKTQLAIPIKDTVYTSPSAVVDQLDLRGNLNWINSRLSANTVKQDDYLDLASTVLEKLPETMRNNINTIDLETRLSSAAKAQGTITREAMTKAVVDTLNDSVEYSLLANVGSRFGYTDLPKAKELYQELLEGGDVFEELAKLVQLSPGTTIDDFGRAVQNSIENIDPVNKLFSEGSGVMAQAMRSAGVQKWYETAVGPTAQKLAKQIGADFEIASQDGIEYAVMKFGGRTNTNNLTLYAGGAPLAAYMAFKEGYTEDEVVQGMLDQGFTPEEAKAAVAKVPQVEEAKALDYSDDEIKEFFGAKQPVAGPEEVAIKDKTTGEDYVPKSTTGDTKSDAAYEILTSGKNISVQELTTALHTVYPDMSSVSTRIAAFFGDDEAMMKAQQTEKAAINNITAAFAARGVKAEFLEGEWYVVASDDDPDDVIRVTPGMWDSFWSTRNEMFGAVAGAVSGGKAGAAMTSTSPNPYARALAIVGGSVAGAVVGSAVGTELDYLRDAVAISEDLSLEIAAHKALTAAEASAIGDLVSLGVLKSVGSSYKGILKAKDFLYGGNEAGARTALRETMFLREDEIDQVVAKLNRTINTAEMSPAQREITATALLLPGAQDLVRIAGVVDAKAAKATVRAINDRAADVLETTSQLAGKGAPVKLFEDLSAYTRQTMDYYGQVKGAAATAPRAKYYKFNLDRAAIEPIYDQLQANIQDPATLERFLLQVNKAKRHANGRTFEDLIELRQIVNDFAFNKKVTNGKAAGALREVIDNIDGHIERGSTFVFGKDKGAAWLSEFGTAKAEYAKMKSLERNTLAKLVRRPGVEPELVSKALLKYSNSMDGTYEHVMGIMPKATRVTVEGDMINTLAQKFSMGDAGQPRAVHFPQLVQELNKISFLTPEARQIKAALTELGDVFQNDVALSLSTGMMTLPKFQSYLTADPVVRAKYELASTLFNYTKTLVPGEANRQAALLRNTAKFLERPLNSKTVKELVAELGDTVNIAPAILKVQQQQGEAIAKGMDVGAARVKFYGNGNIVSTTGKGLEVAIPRHRIATKATAQAIADREAVSPQNVKAYDLVLAKYGFKAVEYGSDKVRLLKP